jgi:peptidoglycan/LPS O-acetylase OafA/YrhL
MKKQNNDSSGRFLGLDGLRGVAVLMVIVWHYFGQTMQGSVYWLDKLGKLLIWTRTGVDMFFVLSGFLITYKLLKDKLKPNFIKDYWIKRIVRIWPAYLLIFFLGVYGSNHFAKYGVFTEHKEVPRSSYLTMTQNYNIASQNKDGSLWLSVTWSLALEWQFYILIFLLIWLVPKRNISQIMLLGIIYSILVRTMIYLIRPNGYIIGYMSLPTRLDSFFMGGLLAIGLNDSNWKKILKRKVKLISIWWWLILLSFSVFILSLAHDLAGTMAVWGHTYLTFLYTFMVYLAMIQTKTLSFLASKFLVFIGRISYELYLIHYGLLWLIFGIYNHEMRIERVADLKLILISLLGTFWISVAVYLLIDRPIVGWVHRKLK